MPILSACLGTSRCPLPPHACLPMPPGTIAHCVFRFVPFGSSHCLRSSAYHQAFPTTTHPHLEACNTSLLAFYLSPAALHHTPSLPTPPSPFLPHPLPHLPTFPPPSFGACLYLIFLLFAFFAAFVCLPSLPSCFTHTTTLLLPLPCLHLCVVVIF